MKEMAKKYDPHQVENKWYSTWEKNDYFLPANEGKTYTISMPPPNITGDLHMGHALNNTLQDALIRRKRMQGYAALWVPGTDHASIATEAKVVAALKEEGKSKEELGREAFLERVWQWKEKYGGNITRQLRRLGCSCDWSRERFTLDEGLSNAVLEVFIRLYEQGSIYRDHYIVNWCPRCRTTLSDIEVEYKEESGRLYHIRYPFADGDGDLVIATTRPETMLGDTAVAVHPDDVRYAGAIGREVYLPVLNRRLEVIADEFVDPEFGTGALKVTPGHDPNDFEIGRCHDLETVHAIDEEGKMTEAVGPYAGLDRMECRKIIVEDLQKQGYLVRVEDHLHAVGRCYRCDSAIEPLVSRQWFVKMKPLAEPAIEVVKEGRVCFVPERFTKIYLRWLTEIRDWCISRQLWWGHRIPVWYCQKCDAEIVARTAPQSCEKCGGTDLYQDPDVLDTWFSSALWPFSTLGWPEETDDLKKFFPTSVLVTGRDIIFFWVARMVFSSLAFMGKEPFSHVLITGLIQDAEGRKMSKSMGTGIDPLVVIEKEGADALRFALVSGSSMGNDSRFRAEKVETARNFTNKLWNASRFLLMNLEGYEPADKEVRPFNLPSRWLMSVLQRRIGNIDKAFEEYRFNDAAWEIYEFAWNEFCDWYIELAKPALYRGNKEEKERTLNVLCYVLKVLLRLLHPLMPFITEEIWGHIPHTNETIMKADWPQVEENFADPDAEEEMDLLQGVIRSIRNIRQEMDIPPARKIRAVIGVDERQQTVLANGAALIQNLAGVEEISLQKPGTQNQQNAITTVFRGIEVNLPLADLMDLNEAEARLIKEKEKLQAELKRVAAKLANEGFVKKAPAHLVEAEKRKEEEYKKSHQRVTVRLDQVQKVLEKK